MSSRVRILALVGALVALYPGVARASSISAITFSSATALDGGDRKTLGWEFSVSTAISVTSLGVFDDGQNGLGESHEVGLWLCATADCLTTGTLVASATVPGGTTGTLSNFFRYTSLGSAVNLAAGSYVIGAAYAENVLGQQLDKVVTGFDTVTGFTSAPAITFIQDRQANLAPGATTPVFATFSGSSKPSYFGPNFQYSTVSETAVPEPSTLVLLGTALVGFAVSRRRRKSA